MNLNKSFPCMEQKECTVRYVAKFCKICYKTYLWETWMQSTHQLKWDFARPVDWGTDSKRTTGIIHDLISEHKIFSGRSPSCTWFKRYSARPVFCPTSQLIMKWPSIPFHCTDGSYIEGHCVRSLLLDFVIGLFQPKGFFKTLSLSSFLSGIYAFCSTSSVSLSAST